MVAMVVDTTIAAAAVVDTIRAAAKTLMVEAAMPTGAVAVFPHLACLKPPLHRAFFSCLWSQIIKKEAEKGGGGGGERRKKEKKRGKEEGGTELPYHGASHQWVTIIIEQSSSQAVKVSSQAIEH